MKKSEEIKKKQRTEKFNITKRKPLGSDKSKQRLNRFNLNKKG